MRTPNAFISYSWDDDLHKDWVKALASKLRGDGVDVTLDRWAVVPGDQLPKFMETSVRENQFVLIVCTRKYKLRSDSRQGGVGYEGDIMTAEVFAGKDPRKFIPVLRAGDWMSASPSWLLGKYGLDLRGDPNSEEQYQDLLSTLHGTREQAPPIGPRPTILDSGQSRRSSSHPLPAEALAILKAAALSDGVIVLFEPDDGLVIFAGDQRFGEPGDPRSYATSQDGVDRLVAAGFAKRDSESSLRITRQGFAYVDSVEPRKAADGQRQPFQFDPIKIFGIIANEIGTPRNDGTRGSALYAVPFQLSRPPTPRWADHFVQTWDHPPSYTTRHRPKIARVAGDRIILDGTTVEEIAEIHRDTLKVVVAKVNQDIENWERAQHRAAEEEAERQRLRRQAVLDAAKKISFD
jgi:hypothetical protein